MLPYLAMNAQVLSSDVPVIAPPNGTHPNFINPPSLHAATVGVGVTTMVLLTVLIGVRTYTKLCIVKDAQHEDFVAMFAWAGFIAWGVTYIHLSSLGFTRDLWNIRAVDLPHLQQLVNSFQPIYSISMLAAKYFCLVQLQRIFCPLNIRTAVWWALQALIIANSIYYIATFFTFLFQCIPREKIWNPAIEGACINNGIATLFAGILNLLLDTAILIIPIWTVCFLQMPLKNKLGAISLFSIGVLTCTIAAIGLSYRVPLLREANQTHISAVVGLWLFGEILGTVAVGCVPLFPRFYRHMKQANNPFKQLFGVKRYEDKGSINFRATSPIENVIPKPRRGSFVRADYYELQDGNGSGPMFKPW